MENTTYLVQKEPRGPSMLVEIPVTKSGLQRIPIPDINQLRSTIDLKVVIKAIRLIPDNVLTHAINQVGVNAPQSELEKMALTLYSEGWERGQYIPLLTLNDTQDPGGTIPFRYETQAFDSWQNVDFPKSYIQLGNGTVTALPGGNPYAILLEVEYQRYDKQNRIVVAPR